MGLPGWLVGFFAFFSSGLVSFGATDDDPIHIPTRTHDVADQDTAVKVAPVVLKLEWLDEAPDSVTRRPQGHVFYAPLRLATLDKFIALSRVGPEILRVHFDDEDPSDLTLVVAEFMGERRGRRRQVSWNGKVTLGGRELTLYASAQGERLFVQLTAHTYRLGRVEDGRMFVLVDQDFDGSFGSAGDFWWFGAAEVAGTRYATRGLNAHAMVEVNEPIFTTSGPYRFRGLEGLGEAVVQGVSDAGTQEEYLARRAARVKTSWFATFESDAKEFRRSRQMDASRSRAETPVVFLHTLDLDAVKAQAKKSGRPIFLDFETDWCTWCHRLDYFTYPDAEVTELLGQFVAVKWNCELDLEKRYEEFGLKGYPHMVVVSPEGKVLHTMGGWKTPAEMVTELETALEAWEKTKAGDENTGF